MFQRMRKWIVLSTVLLAGVMTAGWLFAADYPSRPIMMIIPFAAGGGSDIQGRLVAKYFEKEIGVPMVIKNVPGGSGQNGWDMFAQQKPDGYSLATWNLPHIVMQPLLRPTVYKTETFEPLCFFRFDPVAIYVPKESPFKSLQDFIAQSKKNPGKVVVGCSLKWGHTDAGLWQLRKATGIEVREVNFNSNADLNLSLLGGNVQVAFGNMSVAYAIKDKVRVLGIMHKVRSPYFPDVPTLKELKIPDKWAIMAVKTGFAAPKGTPANIIDKLSSSCSKVLKNKALLSELEKAGALLEIQDRKQAELEVGKYRTLVEEMLRERGMLKK
ncbi:MAG: tripartite tricarboxylate transporter substrate binding protein [Nitrospirae bacterium]|nr:tripartite tricarboxylate transporter substrate binding protein [Nitrospirota bacterium]